MSMRPGWSLWSSARVAAGTLFRVTRRIGAPSVAAAGPPASESGKSPPVATNATPTPAAKVARLMAAAVAYRSCPQSRSTAAWALVGEAGTVVARATRVSDRKRWTKRRGPKGLGDSTTGLPARRGNCCRRVPPAVNAGTGPLARPGLGNSALSDVRYAHAPTDTVAGVAEWQTQPA